MRIERKERELNEEMSFAAKLQNIYFRKLIRNFLKQPTQRSPLHWLCMHWMYALYLCVCICAQHLMRVALTLVLQKKTAQQLWKTHSKLILKLIFFRIQSQRLSKLIHIIYIKNVYKLLKQIFATILWTKLLMN